MVVLTQAAHYGNDKEVFTVDGYIRNTGFCQSTTRSSSRGSKHDGQGMEKAGAENRLHSKLQT